MENRLAHVRAAEGCDLLIFASQNSQIKDRIKRSQPAAAPTEKLIQMI
jgi:hypothetical protein